MAKLLRMSPIHVPRRESTPVVECKPLEAPPPRRVSSLYSVPAPLEVTGEVDRSQGSWLRADVFDVSERSALPRAASHPEANTMCDPTDDGNFEATRTIASMFREVLEDEPRTLPGVSMSQAMPRVESRPMPGAARTGFFATVPVAADRPQSQPLDVPRPIPRARSTAVIRKRRTEHAWPTGSHVPDSLPPTQIRGAPLKPPPYLQTAAPPSPFRPHVPDHSVSMPDVLPWYAKPRGGPMPDTLLSGRIVWGVFLCSIFAAGVMLGQSLRTAVAPPSPGIVDCAWR